MRAPDISMPSPRSMGAGGLLTFIWFVLSIRYGEPIIGRWWAICIGVGGIGFMGTSLRALEVSLNRKRGLVDFKPEWSKDDLMNVRSIAAMAIWVVLCFSLEVFSDRSTIGGYIASAVGAGFILMTLPMGLRWYLTYRYDEEDKKARRPVMPSAPVQHAPKPKLPAIPTI